MFAGVLHQHVIESDLLACTPAITGAAYPPSDASSAHVMVAGKNFL